MKALTIFLFLANLLLSGEFHNDPDFTESNINFPKIQKSDLFDFLDIDYKDLKMNSINNIELRILVDSLGEISNIKYLNFDNSDVPIKLEKAVKKYSRKVGFETVSFKEKSINYWIVIRLKYRLIFNDNFIIQQSLNVEYLLDPYQFASVKYDFMKLQKIFDDSFNINNLSKSTKIIFEVFVKKDGNIGEVKFLEGNDKFIERGETALKNYASKIGFEPAIINDELSDSWAVISLYAK